MNRQRSGGGAVGTGRVQLGTVIGYGAGDFGLNLFYTGLNLYLLYYYTDVVGLAPGIAGSLFMVALLWDAVTDPVMGAVASRTRSPFGRYRPYLLFGGPLLGASFVLLFAAPVLWPAQPVIACLLTHLLFRTVYTVFGVPYVSLSAAMTTDGKTRTSLSGARMQFATLGAIVTAFLTPWLAEQFANGSLVRGYMVTAVVYALLAEAVFLVTFFSVRERADIGIQCPDLMASMRAVRGNHAFWILFASVVMNVVASTIFTKSIIYYTRYVIGEAGMVREVLTFYTIAAAAAVFGWTLLARRTSKTLVLSIGLSLNAVIFLLLFLIAPESKTMFLGFVVMAGIGMAATIVAFWAMLPDTVEFGEWKTGVRDESIFFGLYQFSQKAASGLAVGAVGLILQAIGYVANTDQAAGTLDGLRVLSFALPAAGMAAAAAIIAFYPMRGDRHSRIVELLKARGEG